MNFTILRRPMSAGTPGVMLVEDEWLCYTLEDKVRQDGLKIPGETAIPTDRYPYYMEDSPKFGRAMPTIGGVNGFVGIRTHGGETVDNTEGCPLACFKRLDDVGLKLDHNTSATNKICELLTRPGPHWIEIINRYPYRSVPI